MQLKPAAAGHPLSRPELLTLGGLLFFLPLLEAPKNLLWLAFVLLWIGRAAFTQAGWGGHWQPGRDLPFSLLLMAAATACLLAPPFPQNWGEVGDVLRYTLFGWLLARSRMTDKQLLVILTALLAGTLVAAAQGWWFWKIAGTKSLFELHSVGHTNHSAIYLAMVALGTLGTLLVLWAKLSNGVRASLLLAWVCLTWLIAAGESRGALLAYVPGAVVLLWVFVSRQRRGWLLATGGLALAAMLATSPYLVDKTLSQLQDPATATKSSYRAELARTGIEALRQHPLSGIGPGNFRQATAEQVAAWLATRNETYHPDRYFHSSHAHGLYFNTLAERGLLGGAALLFLALVWLRRLMHRPNRAAHDTPDCLRAPLVWAIGLSGFVVVFVAGLFNTSLHHEHGLLAMFALGLLLAETPRDAYRDM
ncbi:MAG: O-antigen ligase family protein [Rhodocyclaceae bacterium]|nr:O-antigen ligase family protein [Rhodocyclaceae bacterium]